MEKPAFILGVDGGGTQCRARLYSPAGVALGEGVGGPANVRFGIEESFDAILGAARQSLASAGLSWSERGHVVACLALAGVSEPSDRAAVERHGHPFRRVIVTTDAHAACLGAHAGRDGGVIIIGTGSIGWAVIGSRQYRCGGWGFPISDEGSGAWLGCEVLRHTLAAADGRTGWSPMLRAVHTHFESDPNAIVRWMTQAKPRDFATLAPFITAYAEVGDPIATSLLQDAASHIDRLAQRLLDVGAPRLALAGGLAAKLEPWLARPVRNRLVRPAGDAMEGAFHLAQAALESPSLAISV